MRSSNPLQDKIFIRKILKSFKKKSFNDEFLTFILELAYIYCPFQFRSKLFSIIKCNFNLNNP